MSPGASTFCEILCCFGTEAAAIPSVKDGRWPKTPEGDRFLLDSCPQAQLSTQQNVTSGECRVPERELELGVACWSVDRPSLG